MKEKVLVLLACLWLGIGFSMAQAPKTVAGVVTSADDGEPIIGASGFSGRDYYGSNYGCGWQVCYQ